MGPQRATNRRTTARVAYDLIDTLPWLRTESPSRLIPALTRFATTTPAWTAQDLVDPSTPCAPNAA